MPRETLVSQGLPDQASLADAGLAGDRHEALTARDRSRERGQLGVAIDEAQWRGRHRSRLPRVLSVCRTQKSVLATDYKKVCEEHHYVHMLALCPEAPSTTSAFSVVRP